MKQIQLEELTQSTWEEFQADNPNRLYYVLTSLAENPHLSIRNCLVVSEQLKAPVTQLLSTRTENEKERLAAKGYNLNTKQVNYWAYRTQKDKTKSAYMTWGHDLSQFIKPDRHASLLSEFNRYLCIQHNIKCKKGTNVYPCWKIDDYIIFDKYSSYNECQEYLTGQIMRFLAPDKEPLTIGAMLVYRITGDDYLIKDVIERGNNKQPGGITHDKINASLLVKYNEMLKLFQKDILIHSSPERSVPINKSIERNSGFEDMLSP